MANNCLVTKLKESVYNDNLPFIGKSIIHVNAARAFQIGFTENTKISIITDGVTFTNSGAAGLTEQIIGPSTGVSSTEVSVSGECDVLIDNKYTLRYLSDGGSSYITYDVKQINYCINLQFYSQASDSRSYGDLAEFKHCNKLLSLTIQSINITGDLQDLPESNELYFLQLSFASRPTKIGGDILNLSKLPNLTDFIMENMSRLYGNVSVFENLTRIRDVRLGYNQGITGNISSFANHSSLRTLNLYNNNTITGNLRQLVNVPALTGLALPLKVEWTDADAEIIDALLQSNGGTQTQSNYPHYFGGGKHVDSYSS